MDLLASKDVVTKSNLSRRLAAPLIDLLLIGLVIEIIYVIYVAAFPLLSNTRAGGPAADLEILMRGQRWLAPIYAVGLLLLYFLFWQALQVSEKITAADVDGARVTLPFARPGGARFALKPESAFKMLVLFIGLLFGFTLVWLYPITANDLFRYVVRGRVWAIYGESPLLSPPDSFPNDPYLAFAGEFSGAVSAYGPLWELLVQAPLRLGSAELAPGVVSLKLMMLLVYLLLALLIGWVAAPQKSASLKALLFFAWNPLVLMQGLGNGHNDLLFILLLVLGIVLWQRDRWAAAALVLTLAVLAKAPALLMMPLFGVALLRRQPTWRQRLVKGASLVLIGLVTAYLVYSIFGPVSETLRGVSQVLAGRRGFAIASGLRMVLREVVPRGVEAAVNPASIRGVVWLRQALPCDSAGGVAGLLSGIVPCNVPELMPRTTGRYIFVLFYGWLLFQLWRNKLDLVSAGFLAYFSQLMLGRTFRIWYPLWLVPLAALHLTPATFWRTFLFGLAAELSIINYFVVWRWWLRDLPWEKVGLLARGSYYWPVMHILTVPWLFGLPLFGPILMGRRSKE